MKRRTTTTKRRRTRRRTTKRRRRTTRAKRRRKTTRTKRRRKTTRTKRRRKKKRRKMTNRRRGRAFFEHVCKVLGEYQRFLLKNQKKHGSKLKGKLCCGHTWNSSIEFFPAATRNPRCPLPNLDTRGGSHGRPEIFDSRIFPGSLSRTFRSTLHVTTGPPGGLSAAQEDRRLAECRTTGQLDKQDCRRLRDTLMPSGAALSWGTQPPWRVRLPVSCGTQPMRDAIAKSGHAHCWLKPPAVDDSIVEYLRYRVKFPENIPIQVVFSRIAQRIIAITKLQLQKRFRTTPSIIDSSDVWFYPRPLWGCLSSPERFDNRISYGWRLEPSVGVSMAIASLTWASSRTADPPGRLSAARPSGSAHEGSRWLN
ncbi:unnamed protein product [Nesidiocoris tenuis]|uniref:Uncharacterized protein n=1 Tax=Nesidiocoris tenuis TaxID=355587 RepID=A0A6H5HGP7_9HEMI|nr:unnamed protein product [Nesidiocoris tenuis]